MQLSYGRAKCVISRSVPAPQCGSWCNGTRAAVFPELVRGTFPPSPSLGDTVRQKETAIGIVSEHRRIRPGRRRRRRRRRESGRAGGGGGEGAGSAGGTTGATSGGSANSGAA